MSQENTPRRTRLTACLNVPGGMTAADALMLAETAMDMRKSSVNAEIDKLVDKVGVLAARCVSGARDPAVARELYETSNTIHSVAETFQRGQLGLAAYCLCDLLDMFEHKGRWNPEAIRVHAAAILALKDASKVGAREREELIEGLRRVVEREVAAA